MDPYIWLIDRRIVRRNLEKGVINQQQYEQYLRQIKPVAEGEYETISSKELFANKKAKRSNPVIKQVAALEVKPAAEKFDETDIA